MPNTYRILKTLAFITQTHKSLCKGRQCQLNFPNHIRVSPHLPDCKCWTCCELSITNLMDPRSPGAARCLSYLFNPRCHPLRQISLTLEALCMWRLGGLSLRDKWSFAIRQEMPERLTTAILYVSKGDGTSWRAASEIGAQICTCYHTAVGLHPNPVPSHCSAL